MTKPISQTKLLKMLKDAVMDRDLFCPYCEARVYEADYDVCTECGEKNPLRKNGMI